MLDQLVLQLIFEFSIDKVLYLVLLLASFPLAIVFRHVLRYGRVSPTVRHFYLGSIGVIFSLVCYGWDTCFLFLLVIVSYFLFFVFPASRIHWYMMIFALMSLSAAHIYRMMIAFEIWNLDFTGPFMLMVQRVTYVAAAYQDGNTKKDKLSKDQEVNKIEVVPSFVEYSCYCFNYLSFLVSTCGTFVEYLEMVTGKNFKKHGRRSPGAYAQSGLEAALLKTGFGLFMAVLYIYLDSSYTFRDQVLDDSIPFYRKIFIIYLCAFSVRTKYYFAFYLAEGACNAAGMGFNGFDEFDQPRWDLATAMDFKGSEFFTNMRELIASWNSSTSKWLRRCVYERVPNSINPTLMTFIVSALWHGFYPVFYHTFLFFAFSTIAARKVRIHVRPLFQHSIATRNAYDIITTLVSIVCRDYASMVFILLSLPDSLRFASYYYYVLPAAVTLVSLLVPSKSRRHKSRHRLMDMID